METTLTDMAASEPQTGRIEPEDFDWIVRQHQRQIYRILLFLVRDPDAADSLTQDCFLRAFKKHASFRGESSLATWLVRIAINLAHDHNRNRRWAFWRRMVRTGQEDPAPAPDGRRSPEQVLLERERLAAVWSAVETLADRQKTVFMLRFVEEMPLEAISQAMNLELGTVKAHLFRALEAVRTKCRRSGTGART